VSCLLAIWRKELKSYFNSPIAYIFMWFFLVVTALKFFFLRGEGPQGQIRDNFFVTQEASLTAYFSVFPIALGVLVPMLCMRMWPEEYKSGTIETLMTLPVKAWQVVCGKFAAMLSILAVTFALSLTVPWSVNEAAVSAIDIGPIIGGYVGAFLMGAAYCAVGLLMSSFTREQVIALLSTFIVSLPLALAGTAYVEGPTPDWLSPIAKFVGFAVRFQSIERGVLDMRDMLYFLSVTVLFVFLNITVVEARRLK
jgi:ABC-2 type transport system permease protein